MLLARTAYGNDEQDTRVVRRGCDGIDAMAGLIA
jgi:hypothetical protein